LSHFLGYAATLVVTLSVGISLALLISRLPAHKDPPGELLRSAGALWICNLLVFACWYWRLDAGGPHQRALPLPHGRRILVSADGVGCRSSEGNGRGPMATWFR